MSTWGGRGVAGLGIALAVWGVGCGSNPDQARSDQPLQVSVAVPLAQVVTDYEIFSGRTEAVESTDVRARVSGYVDKVAFADGAYVRAGDVLFVIDPRPYAAALAKAKASVAQAVAAAHQGEASVVQAESNLTYHASELQRNRRLASTGAVSGSEMDKSRGDVNSTTASVNAAKATVEVARANVKAAEAEERVAQLNMDFTTVTAPISGFISRRLVDRGALVTADQTVLTNIVRHDKVYANFDIDERTWLDLRRRLIAEGRIDAIHKAVLPLWVGLASDSGFGFEGRIDFADNKLDPSTGTMRMRGILDNPDGYFQPGMFVRVRLPVGQPHEVLLIDERAIASDQGRQFVYVLNDKNEIVYRRVDAGALHDGLREIKSAGHDTAAPPDANEGLRKGERVVLNGHQRLRLGMRVEPTVGPMPNPRQAALSARPKADPRAAEVKAKAAQAGRVTK